MSYSAPLDPSINYHNPFSNTIFNQPTTKMSSNLTTDPDLQRFTAVGRPMPSRNNDSGLAGGFTSMETYGRSAPNLLPFRFTDASIISVPVLPHAEPSQAKSEDNDSDSDQNPVKETKSRSRFSISSFRRKSSSGNTKKAKQDFIIKEMPRGEYLKHYAKDDNGKYIGSEEPALDCILNTDEDRAKWGRARTGQPTRSKVMSDTMSAVALGNAWNSPF